MENVNPSQSKQRDLNGVRGWLLLFNIYAWLTLCTYTLAAISSSMLSGADKAINLIASVPAILMLFLVVRLLRARNILFRKIYVIFTCFTALMLLVQTLRGNPITGLAQLPLGELLCCLYLYRSKRVRVTCGLEQPEAGAEAEAYAPSTEPPLAEGEGTQGGPAAKLTYFYLPHCPHCKLASSCIEELRSRDPRYRLVEIDMVDESVEKELAEGYDYYYVPAFFAGRQKLYEGHAEMADVQAVLDAALSMARQESETTRPERPEAQQYAQPEDAPDGESDGFEAPV